MKTNKNKDYYKMSEADKIKSGNRKLTQAQIDEIFLLKGKDSLRLTAAKFGVTKQRIWQIQNTEAYERLKEQHREWVKNNWRKTPKEIRRRYSQTYKANRKKAYKKREQDLEKALQALQWLSELSYGCNTKKITHKDFFFRVHNFLRPFSQKYYDAASRDEVISLFDLVVT